MSDLITLTRPFKGTISKSLLDYIKALKEGNKEDRELVENLDRILRVALLSSNRAFISKLFIDLEL